jgi:hypothetical protein
MCHRERPARVSPRQSPPRQTGSEDLAYHQRKSCAQQRAFSLRKERNRSPKNSVKVEQTPQHTTLTVPISEETSAAAGSTP